MKRFDNFIRKTNTLVDFPVDTLDLSEYVIGYDKDSYVYELYGICNHMGTVMGGHYTAFVKHKDSLTWYHYNDTKVTPVEDTDTMKTPQAYCLFYKKKISQVYNIHMNIDVTPDTNTSFLIICMIQSLVTIHF